jgi:hypothetical protein
MTSDIAEGPSLTHVGSEVCIAAAETMARRSEIGFVHRKRYQEIPGDERMGIRPVSL